MRSSSSANCCLMKEAEFRVLLEVPVEVPVELVEVLLPERVPGLGGSTISSSCMSSTPGRAAKSDASNDGEPIDGSL